MSRGWLKNAVPAALAALLAMSMGGTCLADSRRTAIPLDIDQAATAFVDCLQGVPELLEFERNCGAAVAWSGEKFSSLKACLIEKNIKAVYVFPNSGTADQSAILAYSCRGRREVGVRLDNRGLGFKVDFVGELVTD